jgi:LacI family transcriptional regulator
LHDHKNISPETKKRVLELVQRLNYLPNSAAQSLRTHRTRTLGVVVPEIVMHFFSNTLSGIQEYAALHNYTINISQSMESFSLEETNVQKLISNRVDGLMISLSSGTANVDHLRQLIEKEIPLVLFDRVWEDLEVSKVVVDDQKASFQAVDYLVKTACRRIAYIGGPDNLYVSKERELGYRRALQANALQPDDELIIHCKDLHTGPVEAVLRLLSLDEPPDAIFCMNDPIAIQVMQILKERQIKIPEEISLIGFTNEPVSNFIEPSLTTVAQPSYEMGKMAASLLIGQLERPHSFKPSTIVLETKLIIRNSTRKVE